MIPILFLNGIIGTLSGCVWAFALGKSLTNGLYYGMIAGLILGLFFYLFGKMAITQGNINKREGTFVTGSLSGMILMIALITALITWIIRLIFF